ncbi:MAG: glycosyltransferase family 2 protein [Sutterellaceae bacterium]|nr:glycosyltransferase family 2 protein [Sutterellaceae bacterium]MDY2869035.1 glycosyltransferase family 2 protein [Mesosutterella sp.]
MKKGLTALILAKNEERNIADCVKSVAFADKIIVIDDFSIDKTRILAENAGAVVVQHSLSGDWGQQRNFAISLAETDWTLFVDADERISKELAEEITSVISSDKKAAYLIKRENRFHNNHATHGVLRPDFVKRLFPTEGTRVEGKVHEMILSPYPEKKLSAPMYHYTYDNWDQYLGKLNHYTSLAAVKYADQRKKCSFWGDVVLRPIWAFFKVYFFNGGFLDGKMGWVLSVNHYFYTFNKYVKLYYLYKDKGKL